MGGDGNERKPRPATDSDNPESAPREPASSELPGERAAPPSAGPAPQAATDEPAKAEAESVSNRDGGQDSEPETGPDQKGGQPGEAASETPADQSETRGDAEPSASDTTSGDPTALVQRPVTTPERAAPPPPATKPSGGVPGKLILVLLVLAAGAAFLWYQQRPAPTPSAGVPPAPGLAAAELTELETLLGELSFDPGSADGVVDDQTRDAIRLFQEFASLPVDGEPSDALLTELREVAKLLGKDG